MTKKHNILICPLEWGLGHAARMIPVATGLAAMGQNVIIASGEEHLSMFRREIPGISCISFPGFSPGYSRHLPQYAALLLRIPLLVYHIIKEHRRLDTLIDEYDISIVISDNRFGLWNRKVKSVYLTHMPLIPFPRRFRGLERIGIWLHGLIIRKYDLCLIPDIPDVPGLAGRLTHSLRLPENTRFTGLLSRFPATRSMENKAPVEKPYNIILLSGPEPQRSLFREKAIRHLASAGKKIVILEGKPSAVTSTHYSGDIISINHAETPVMEALLKNSDYIVARAGYSSVMDLTCLGLTALLVPTPGQTEQEYLAGHLGKNGWFPVCKQSELGKPGRPPEKSFSVPEGLADKSRVLLKETLEELLK